MASGNRTLTVTFAGDTDQLEKASKDAAKAVDHVNEKAGELGETFGSTATQSAQVAGGLGDLGGALSQMGGPSARSGPAWNCSARRSWASPARPTWPRSR